MSACIAHVYYCFHTGSLQQIIAIKIFSLVINTFTERISISQDIGRFENGQQVAPTGQCEYERAKHDSDVFLRGKGSIFRSG